MLVKPRPKYIWRLKDEVEASEWENKNSDEPMTHLCMTQHYHSLKLSLRDFSNF